MFFKENLKMALDSIFANKMRSFLTMLGIIIGIASVIAILAVGNGAASEITGTFSDQFHFLLHQVQILVFQSFHFQQLH